MARRSILQKLKHLFSRKTAARALREDPTFNKAVARASEIYSEIPLGRFIDEQRREALARELFLELNDICSARDPKTACRDKLVRSMLRFAPLQVVMIPPPPDEDTTGLRDLPGITGELQPRLRDLMASDAEFRSDVVRAAGGDEPENAWAALQRSYWETYWFLEAFNATRIELGDTNADSDWYRPFMHAACVNQEHIYRRELDLPPAFDENVAQVVVTAFSIYTDVVVSGTDDPDSEWKAYYDGLGVPPVDGPERRSAG